jgi:hypothetical protein
VGYTWKALEGVLGSCVRKVVVGSDGLEGDLR